MSLLLLLMPVTAVTESGQDNIGYGDAYLSYRDAPINESVVVTYRSENTIEANSSLVQGGDGGLAHLEALGNRIKWCESRHQDNICNREYGCDYGEGRWQLIPRTARHCAEEMGRPIDPSNPEDNEACGWWLLENEGWHHWGYPADDPRGYMENGERWGSYDCFSDYI